jgi:hypothetical protein
VRGAPTVTIRRRRGSEVKGGFDRNVFINCPFDKNYMPLLRPLLFTVIYLGLNPRIALESKNSGSPRVEKIIDLIRGSLFAIHDLSRNRAKKKGELYRLNMPFELGLDVGCQRFSSGRHKRKILDAENYQYQAALSDIAGSDIENHRNEPREVVVHVRNWLSSEARLNADGPTKIWNSFNDFTAVTSVELRNDGFLKEDVEKLPTSELLDRMRDWCKRKAS